MEDRLEASRLLPGRMVTARLLIRDAGSEDCEGLQQLYETGAYLEPWFGQGVSPGYIRRLLTEGDLPPGGRKERFKLQAVFRQEGGEPIGLLELYHGYPHEGTLWIACLYLYPGHQQQGYGREIVTRLLAEAVRAGYTGAGVGVQLKNWPALRFWFSLGFDLITGIYGDRTHSEATFATIGLHKTL